MNVCPIKKLRTLHCNSSIICETFRPGKKIAPMHQEKKKMRRREREARKRRQVVGLSGPKREEKKRNSFSDSVARCHR